LSLARREMGKLCVRGGGGGGGRGWLGGSEHTRMRQLKRALEKARAAAGECRAVVCGDLNALVRADYPDDDWQRLVSCATQRGWEPRQELVTAHLASEEGLVDAFATAGEGDGYTFHLRPAEMWLRLDYVWLPAHTLPWLKRCWVDKAAAATISCHLPVLADLELSCIGEA
jgi:endonuclease/exonuclease/phosphatase family metal-dependent hydrolase